MHSRKNGFTLPEMLIGMMVIGFIAVFSIVQFTKSKPSENLLKFHNADETLFKVINELVRSGEYNLQNDLGRKPDGTLIDGTHEGDYTHFCKSFANLLGAKSVNCQSQSYSGYGFIFYDNQLPSKNLSVTKQSMDSNCYHMRNDMGNEIISSNNVHYYQVNAQMPFGVSTKNGFIALNSEEQSNSNLRLFGGEHVDSNGFDAEYKIFCIDVDKNNPNANEKLFSYGIRADGKIIRGQRADEWYNRSVVN